MDPDLPKGSQYRQIFPNRGVNNCVPNDRTSSLKEIKAEAAEARKEEDLKAKVEAAKWRSVEQGCNYDQYRQMCLGADLKGLPSGVVMNVLREESKPINRRTRRRGNKETGNAEMQQQPAPTEPPSDRDEFERQWRGACKDCERRYAYMKLIPIELICKLFKKGVEEHLGLLLLSLRDGWDGNDEDCAFILRWLLTLPETFRFDLAVGFLSDSEKAATSELLARLSHKVNVAGTIKDEDGHEWNCSGIEDACRKYCVELD